MFMAWFSPKIAQGANRFGGRFLRHVVADMGHHAPFVEAGEVALLGVDFGHRRDAAVATMDVDRRHRDVGAAWRGRPRSRAARIARALP
jgi:hypothetical protein